MTSTISHPREVTRRSAAIVIPAAVAVAVVGNLVIYGLGRLAGGDFTFTQAGERITVDATTVAGLSAIPLGVGLILTFVLTRWVPVVRQIAMVVAPALALLTIAMMTIPADFDLTSTLTLALCHVTLVPISICAIRGLPTASRGAKTG